MYLEAISKSVDEACFAFFVKHTKLRDTLNSLLFESTSPSSFNLMGQA